MNFKNETIVLKFGTTSVCDTETLEIRKDWIQSVAEDIKQLIENGNRPVIFSSGGLATGKKRGRNFLRDDLLFSNKNLMGAVGLSELLFRWQVNFEKVGLQVATLVMREEDIDTTRICDLIIEMTENQIVPVINENIPLQNDFNNDELAAKVCKKIGATKFVLFTDTNGIFTDNPKSNPDAKHLKSININSFNIGLEGSGNGLGTGGMKAKLASAAAIKKTGIDTFIANGVDFFPVSNLKNEEKFTVLKNEAV